MAQFLGLIKMQVRVTFQKELQTNVSDRKFIPTQIFAKKCVTLTNNFQRLLEVD